MIAPRRLGGTSRITVVMSSGIMIAVPDACTTRAANSTPKAGAIAAMAVPMLNSPMASMNSRRSGCRSSSHPVRGITIAIVSMNAVVSHCTTRSSIANSPMMRVNATFIAVSLRITTNAAIHRVRPNVQRMNGLLPTLQARPA